MPCRRSSWGVPLLFALACWGCGGPAAEGPAWAGAAESPRAAPAPGETRHPPNRLARESSPYLLLHARNPVDWHPWGPEALERARTQNKPIFLSIGYSTCHWCHVMERLVFRDEEVARFMNEHFVNIKVDREERPDVDDVYMTALRAYFEASGTLQAGGWPLSMFLTPEGKPVAGGTYFPPEDQDGRPGFPSVMRAMLRAWTEDREAVERNAELLTQVVRRALRPGFALERVPLDRELADGAVQALVESYDAEYGGIDFSPHNPEAPKFPVPAKLALLHDDFRRHGHDRAGRIVHHTLDRLAAGGIHDHLAGGFHRYSTDRRWHVPHFEKMLYDQAQLADLSLEAWRRTNNRRHRDTAEGIFAFVLRDMTDPQGGFYSALDADTDGVEGLHYVWSREEVEQVLGRVDAAVFQAVYGMNEPQRFEHGYVLHLPRPVDDAADALEIPAGELRRRLAGMRQKLYEARGRRPPLLRDDKVIASWNGLMIRALAQGAAVLGRDDYLQAAEKAALFVLSSMRRPEDGRLHRTWRGGRASGEACLDDYAFLVHGLLALHEASRNEKWLNAARRLTDDQIALFHDERGKGFFFTSHAHEELLARTKTARDSVLPSGNSITVRNLVRLASATGEEKYRRHAEETLELFAPELKERPRGAAHLALALGEFLDAGFLDAEGAADPGAEPRGGASLPDPFADFPAGRTRPGSDFDPAEVPANAPPADQPGPPVRPVGATQAEPEDKAQKEEELVTGRAFLSMDKLPRGGTCRIVMLLTIKEGWHINAHPARPEGLVPTTFSIKSEEGVRLSSVQYPPGTRRELDGFDEPARVYEKRVAIYGTLTIPAGIAADADEMELRVRYQPCSESQCLPPKTFTLKGRVPIARPGEPTKEINEKLFPPEAEDGRRPRP